jgi:hypothetical protein
MGKRAYSVMKKKKKKVVLCVFEHTIFMKHFVSINSFERTLKLRISRNVLKTYSNKKHDLANTQPAASS